MYETMILTFDVESYSDGRRIAERIENQKFDSHTELLERIKAEIGGADKKYNKAYDDHAVQLWSLTDFMDACNNEEIFLDDLWIGYVQLKKA